MKNLFVATIGTRDLMFQVSSGEWFNLGDDQMRDDIISEQSEVVSDLELPDLTNHRELTEYLLQSGEKYLAKIKPVILGQIFAEKYDQLEKVYLIGTDQQEIVKERSKDTIYSAQLIEKWLNFNYPTIKTEIIPLGQAGENPSDFEAMFRWWLNTWQTQIKPNPGQKLWVCLKGGVGQFSEACRISGLNLYGEQIQFFEIHRSSKDNRQGIPSGYTGPFLGTNYLWSGVQKQALELLKNHNYLAVQNLLTPYFEQTPEQWQKAQQLLNGAIAWNQGRFDQFYQQVQSYLDQSQRQQKAQYWWQAYEQAYIAVIRLEQNNTTEAMLHSFRAIEGLIDLWIRQNFSEYLANKNTQSEFLELKSSILKKYSSLGSFFNKYGKSNKETIQVRGEVQSALIRVLIPEAQHDKGFVAWDSKNARDTRNSLSHNLGGISEKDLYKAWGTDIAKSDEWQGRILQCINLITGEQFSKFNNASFFPGIHHALKAEVKNYQV
ncbi:hypothetical protein [Synechocystis salina]|uniref:Uncharacterized protein n=1 Tax=Synechocystis salina LEGE 00031 TaxID=1828736 RepID=A0ABR9VSY3_9SYNC|nr:hypothetical protein [Synechocystis salina]MBE9242214.1 hypothetical protein [Synechocystis salina LEGE 00041]MBE9254464.1 hypothetical protein [Synechocystis salina LEGE 00031]